MKYKTDKGREQIAAQRRVVSARKRRRLEIIAPTLLKAAREVVIAGKAHRWAVNSDEINPLPILAALVKTIDEENRP